VTQCCGLLRPGSQRFTRSQLRHPRIAERHKDGEALQSRTLQVAERLGQQAVFVLCWRVRGDRRFSSVESAPRTADAQV
jgi:hypothetical protein